MIRLFGHLYDPVDRGPSVVTVDDGVIAAIEPADAPPPGCLGGRSSRLVPGLVDIQLNGAFGDDFADPRADTASVCRRLPSLGVTAFAPTVVTSPPEVYPAALANLRRDPRPGEARVLGVHIEGPFISPAHHGTHDPGQLRLPDLAEAAAWLEAGDLRWVTLAPELPGALELTAFLASRGVRVSMGHTDATWAEAEAAVAAGVTMATHLFNAMRPLRHRDPGVAGFALATGLRAGVIADGHHLAFETLRLVARVKAPDELYLVTDALAGLGMGLGRFVLAGREIISDGTCGRLPDGTLSGSLLPMPLALRNLVEKVGLDPALAIRMATLNPARAIGVDDRVGRVAVGRPADVVVLAPDWEVEAAVAGGALAFSRQGSAAAAEAQA